MNALLNQQRPLNPSIQLKLQLLENIQKGNYQRVKQLAYVLSKVNNTNPQLYGKISTFVHQHKEQLNDIDLPEDDDNDEPEIINIDDDFVQGHQWDSQQSIQYESDQEEEEIHKNVISQKVMAQKPQIHKKQMFKDVKNTMQRRSVSNKKLTPANNTYQFKSPAKIPLATINKPASQLKHSSSKAQLHKNSAIGRTRNPISH